VAVEPPGCPGGDRWSWTSVVGVLLEPAPALTDLLLGLVVLGLAVGLRRVAAVHRYWRGALWWAGFGALGGSAVKVRRAALHDQRAHDVPQETVLSRLLSVGSGFESHLPVFVRLPTVVRTR
jgi:hypothetical protein